MNRKAAYRCLTLLSVVGAGLGCDVDEVKSAEQLGQLESAAIVSSIAQGEYVIRSAMTGKCVDLDSGSTADGAKIQQWDCNGTNAQRFRVTPTSGGYFSIINVGSNKGLDIKDVSTAENAPVHQWSYLGANNQQFKFVGRGNNQFSIHPRHTDLALDLYWGSAANGTGYVQYRYSGGANQHFTFDKVDGGGGGNNGGTGIAAILSEGTFNAMFPNRNGLYTYSALVAAANTFPTFATTGDLDTRKREVTAFLANVAHETGHLVYSEEINKSTMCDTSWGPPGCGCAAGKMYFGRGPIQLSWNGNYCAAGNALGVDLKNNPDLVARDSTIAWRTGLWFWMTQTGAGSMTAHDAMVNNRGFGETIRTINGSVECYGRRPDQVQSRQNNYSNFAGRIGVSVGSTNTGC